MSPRGVYNLTFLVGTLSKAYTNFFVYYIILAFIGIFLTNGNIELFQIF